MLQFQNQKLKLTFFNLENIDISGDSLLTEITTKPKNKEVQK